jgi:hypothetical protein
MRRKTRLLLPIILVLFLQFLFSVGVGFAHKVEQDSSGNSLNLTVSNSSSKFKLRDVTVSVTSTPSWITMGSGSQALGDISGGGSKVAAFTFSVGQGSDVCDIPTGTIECLIESASGDSTTKSIPVEMELDDTTPPAISITGASNGAIYYMPTSVTINYSVSDDKDPNPQITFASVPSGTVFDSIGSYSVSVNAQDCAGNTASESIRLRIAHRPRPDDNKNLSDGTPSPIISDPFAQVAVLNKGLVSSLCTILKNINESYAIIDLPANLEALSKHPLLLIPSGGFTGLDNSPSLKKLLKEYVENGGLLVSFTQERGYQFDILPDAWEGAGYQEEEGCLSYAGGIENQHVIFSGQNSVYIDANVDGYFTSWPENGTVLMRRTKNSMPCIIHYDMGDGTVLATSLYSDYGYLSGQINADEKKLIRDIISWGKDIETPINSYLAGEQVEETITIANTAGGVDAQAVEIMIYDPDGNLIDSYEETLAAALPSDQYTELDFNWPGPEDDSPLGIYWLKYVLKDADGGTVQDEQPSCRFAVVKEIGTVDISKDINVVVKKTQSYYPIDSTGSFQVVVYNSKDEDQTVRVRFGTQFHEPRYRGGYGSEYTELVVPANDSASLTFSVENLSRGDSVSAGVYTRYNRLLAFGQERFHVFYPSVEAQASLDKNEYISGDSGLITYSLTNVRDIDYQVTANILILDQAGNKVVEESRTLMLNASETVNDDVAFTAPDDGGPYVVQIEATSFGSQLGSVSGFFIVIVSDFLNFTPHYPATWVTGGTNTVTYDVENTSESNLPVGTVKTSLFDPDGAAVWTGAEEFTDLPAGETTTVSLDVPLDNAKFGTYRLKSELLYLGNHYEYYSDFNNRVAFDLKFDKNHYIMRENITATLEVINTGVFEQTLAVDFEVPSFNVSESRDVFLSTERVVEYTTTVPDTIAAGRHDVNVSLTAGSKQTRSYRVNVPGSNLELSSGKDACNAGESGKVTISNTGGVDAGYEIQIWLYDMNGKLVNELRTTGSVQANTSQGIDIAVPAPVVTGDYLIKAECKNLLNVNQTVNLGELLAVSGHGGEVSVRTDKKTYLFSDLKTILSNLTNSTNKTIDGAKLRLRIYAQTDCKLSEADPDMGGYGGEGEGAYIYPVPDQFVCFGDEIYQFDLHPYEYGGGGEIIDPRVLMVVDTDSWNTRYQNRRVLNDLDIPYTSISPAALDEIDLYEYTHLLIPSDQGQSMYNNLDANMERITEWVEAGGSFQFNACDVGWQDGSWTNGPGGLTHVTPVFRQQNYIVEAGHFVLEGMSNSDFYNWN